MVCLTWTAMEVVVWVGVGGACGPITSGPICRHDQHRSFQVRQCPLIIPPRADAVHISNTHECMARPRLDVATHARSRTRRLVRHKGEMATWRLHAGD